MKTAYVLTETIQNISQNWLTEVHVEKHDAEEYTQKWNTGIDSGVCSYANTTFTIDNNDDNALETLTRWIKEYYTHEFTINIID